MQLIPNWKSVVTRSFSMWALYICLLVFAGAEVLYALWTIETDPYVTGMALFGALVSGVLGRLVDQGIA